MGESTDNTRNLLYYVYLVYHVECVSDDVQSFISKNDNVNVT